jgi:hypothetical protein
VRQSAETTGLHELRTGPGLDDPLACCVGTVGVVWIVDEPQRWIVGAGRSSGDVGVEQRQSEAPVKTPAQTFAYAGAEAMTVGTAAAALAAVIVEPMSARSVAAAVINSGDAITNDISHLPQSATSPAVGRRLVTRRCYANLASRVRIPALQRWPSRRPFHAANMRPSRAATGPSDRLVKCAVGRSGIPLRRRWCRCDARPERPQEGIFTAGMARTATTKPCGPTTSRPLGKARWAANHQKHEPSH